MKSINIPLSNSILVVKATPTTFDYNGVPLPTGVYSLTANGEDYGEIAFEIKDVYEWEYSTDKLTQEQLDQVVYVLQRDLNGGENMDSFVFNETVDGVEHFYRITQSDGSFGVEKDGYVIAELEHEEDWIQISGMPLSEEVINKLAARIEDHYE
ncbi:hypothetical protein DYU05_06085 [Mucilaginibacter terrenus]|uniref:Uncharacterized protein n=1 Tax=Mucilaginibacter terrenus TaxID=2482727 RepID=A0A3E2NW27_9SPHI|nr:hypothetical protein [Mucilaginibacter terrenus]RFZ85167.1 hypothetical protein DYU05_06085 [Mucilaginibacter terrenus]